MTNKRVKHWNYQADEVELGTVIDESSTRYRVVPDVNLDMQQFWNKVDCEEIK